MAVVAAVVERLGKTFSVPPMKRGAMRGRGGADNPDAMSTLERLCHWITTDASNMEGFPELGHVRDLTFLFKLAMQPTEQFWAANAKGGRGMFMFGGGDGMASWPTQWFTSQVRPTFRMWDLNHDQTIAGLLCTFCDHRHTFEFAVQPAKSPVDLERWLGRANPTEEDVLHNLKLPSFGDTLSPEESERFFAYLTAPDLAIPLLLAFFAEDRAGVLLNADLRELLESVLYQPGATHLNDTDPIIDTVPVPEDQREKLLGTRWGRLFQEMIFAPGAVLSPLLKLGESAAGLCVGPYNSSFVDLLLFIIRVACTVEAFALAADSHPEMRLAADQARSAVSGTEGAVAAAAKLRAQLRTFLVSRCQSMIRLWIAQSEAAGDTAAGTKFHAHIALIYVNGGGVTADGQVSEQFGSTSVLSLLTSAAYVVSWHSKGGEKGTSARRQARRPDIAAPSLTMPLSDVFMAMQRRRGAILDWAAMQGPEELSTVLGTVVGVALSRENMDVVEEAEASEGAGEGETKSPSSKALSGGASTWRGGH